MKFALSGCAVMALAAGGHAAPIGYNDFSSDVTQITFSEAAWPGGDVVNYQGLTFTNLGGGTGGPGTEVNNWASFFDNLPLGGGGSSLNDSYGDSRIRIEFNQTVFRVGIEVSTSPVTAWTLEAYDSGGTLLDSVTGTMPAAADAVFIGLQTPNIAYVEVFEPNGENGNISLFDNLRFDAIAPQGPAGLWIHEDAAGGGPDDDLIFELNEVLPAMGAVVSTEDTGFAADMEYDVLNDVFYLTGNGQNNGLQIVDRASGAIVPSPGINAGLAAIGQETVTAAEIVGTTLFGAATTIGGGGGPSDLVRMDPNSGDVVLVGPTGLNALGGLAYNGTMYAITAGGANPAELYTINLSTGAATLVGSTGVQMTGLEFGADGVLYGLGRNPNNVLYTLDPATGAVASIGTIADAVFTNAITSDFPSRLPCPADLTGDGVINIADLNAVLGSFNTDAGGDVDGDGDTDIADLNAVLADFGELCP